MQILREKTNLCDDILGIISEYLAPNVVNVVVEKYRVIDEIRYQFSENRHKFVPYPKIRKIYRISKPYPVPYPKPKPVTIMRSSSKSNNLFESPEWSNYVIIYGLSGCSYHCDRQTDMLYGRPYDSPVNICTNCYSEVENMSWDLCTKCLTALMRKDTYKKRKFKHLQLANLLINVYERRKVNANITRTD
jgi:hypothetical protein